MPGRLYDIDARWAARACLRLVGGNNLAICLWDLSGAQVLTLTVFSL
jgi:hypothetical protein